MPALEQTEFSRGFDFGVVVARSRGDADDLGLRGLGLQDEGRQIGRCERRAHRAEHLSAILGDHRRGISFKRMPERIVVGDKKPCIAAALDHFLRGAHRERMGVEYPLDRIGRTELAVKIRCSGRMRDEHLFLVVGDVLYREPDRRDRHVHNQVYLFSIVPAPRDTGSDIGLELMIADNHADRLAQNLAAEIVHRHLRRGHRSLAGRRGRGAVHIGENPDLDHIVRHLRQCRGHRQHRRRERREHGYFSD